MLLGLALELQGRDLYFTYLQKVICITHSFAVAVQALNVLVSINDEVYI